MSPRRYWWMPAAPARACAIGPPTIRLLGALRRIPELRDQTHAFPGSNQVLHALQLARQRPDADHRLQRIAQCRRIDGRGEVADHPALLQQLQPFGHAGRGQTAASRLLWRVEGRSYLTCGEPLSNKARFGNVHAQIPFAFYIDPVLQIRAMIRGIGRHPFGRVFVSLLPVLGK